MIRIKTNLKAVTEVIQARLNRLNDPELLQPVALAMITTIAIRIHKDGKDSSGGQIGKYSSSYLRLRSGQFLNAGKNDSGKFTGAVIKLNKKTGVFSGVEKEGLTRPNYYRSTNPKVIISLTRQLENDYAVIAIPKGYAIGFNNKLNYDKSQWVQQTYGKKIFDLTPDEQKLAVELIADAANQALTK